MNEVELKKIKEKALEDHIPIIMDDTLEVIDEILKEAKPKAILDSIVPENNIPFCGT